jgi:glycosyltransferase involved in cell wall biosynthesis
MKIAVLLDEQFPFGMASANRTLLYSKGLVELDNDVVILVPRATERSDRIRNVAVRGKHEGVEFRYAYESVIRKSFIGRRIQNSVSLLNSFIFFIRFRPDIIIVAANNFKYIALGKTCSVITGAKLVREKSEVPFFRLEELSSVRRLRVKTEFRLFNGMIVISGALKDFFLEDLKLKLNIIEVPILVDSRTINQNGMPLKEPALVYTGSLLDHKDGVLTIIKAFALALQKYPHLKLIMTGNIEVSPDKKEILSTLERLKLKDNVELPGYLTREKLNELTSSATALLLAKPLNRQNRYNMATKIGEYLMTGRPAVISSVDPVCRHLRHRKDACITQPDEGGMAREIEFLLDNPAEADKIGSTGRQSAAELFDYKIHALRIDKFLSNL